MSIYGHEQVMRNLRKLEIGLQRKVLSRSIRDGMKYMAGRLKAASPVETGVMRSTVKVRVAKKKKRGEIKIQAQLGPDSRLVKFTRTGERHFYPAVVEYGAPKRGRAGQFWMKATFDRDGVTAAAIVRRRIEFYLKRLAHGILPSGKAITK